MESEGIKAYRQVPADSGSTPSELPIPNLSSHSHFTEVPVLSPEAQAPPTAIGHAQAAPHSISEEEGKMLPTVPFSQVPVAIQQMVTSPRQVMQSEPAVFQQGGPVLPEAAAAADTVHLHDSSVVAAQNTYQSQQDEADPPAVASQSQQNGTATASASDVMPEGSLASHGGHAGHTGG